MANKSAEKPYYVSILYHRAPNGIRSDGERNRKEFQIIKNGKYRAKICKKSAF